MTKFAVVVLTVVLLVGSGSSIHTTSTKLRQTADTTNTKPVGSNDGNINTKKSMKSSPFSQPSAFPSSMPSAQPMQKKSGKGMMTSIPGKPSY